MDRAVNSIEKSSVPQANGMTPVQNIPLACATDDFSVEFTGPVYSDCPTSRRLHVDIWDLLGLFWDSFFHLAKSQKSLIKRGNPRENEGFGAGVGRLSGYRWKWSNRGSGPGRGCCSRSSMLGRRARVLGRGKDLKSLGGCR